MHTPADVPSPIDLQSPLDAAAWESKAMQVRPWRVEFFDRFAAEIASRPGPKHVLELGSGPGFLAAHLLAAVPDLTLVLLDFSGAMHALARKRLAPVLDQVRFVERSFKDPDWTEGLGRHDFVVTNQAIHELRHKRYATALHAQVRDVLAWDGAYLVSDHYAGAGGMSNTELYMTVDEHRTALVGAGYRSVAELMNKGGMVLNRAA